MRLFTVPATLVAPFALAACALEAAPLPVRPDAGTSAPDGGSTAACVAQKSPEKLLAVIGNAPPGLFAQDPGDSEIAKALAGSGGVVVGRQDRAPPGGVRLVAEDIEVEGPLERDTLAAAVHPRLAAVRSCYQQALKKAPALQGRIVVHFRIGRAGQLSNVEIDRNTLGDDALAACVIARFYGGKVALKLTEEAEASVPFTFARPR